MLLAFHAVIVLYMITYPLSNLNEEVYTQSSAFPLTLGQDGIEFP